MDVEFWTQKWQTGQIGFHLPHPNPLLLRYWSAVAPAAPVTLVPMCGKSLDLNWLADQGRAVIGIELDRRAVEQFFDEQGVQVQPQACGAHQRYRAPKLEILQGDFFTVQPSQLPECNAFYDRAALIALPAEMRQAYIEQLAALLPVGASGLLITLEYPQAQKAGPPFSLTQEALLALCQGRFELTLLSREDVLAEPENARFVAQGVTWLNEAVYRLRRL
ncbi:thiopurine S-methyltransferase [Ferrimonas pelagia]|uniref:Thiopurine S-methyltransferase n=1 Tax=Ferrimonas pelagia TaxID=1177826 RepID=A0ABP9FE52_9GAMM